MQTTAFECFLTWPSSQLCSTLAALRRSRSPPFPAVFVQMGLKSVISHDCCGLYLDLLSFKWVRTAPGFHICTLMRKLPAKWHQVQLHPCDSWSRVSASMFDYQKKTTKTLMRIRFRMELLKLSLRWAIFRNQQLVPAGSRSWSSGHLAVFSHAGWAMIRAGKPCCQRAFM